MCGQGPTPSLAEVLRYDCLRTAERRDFYRALDDAIVDAIRKTVLDTYPLWRDTAPSDPFSLAQPAE